MLYPHRFGEEGWYNFQPSPYAHGAMEVWYGAMRPEDRQRLPGSDWLAYLEGRNPSYPEQALQVTHVTHTGRATPLDASCLTVRLEAGAGAQLVLGMRRYVNQPTLAHPPL